MASEFKMIQPEINNEPKVDNENQMNINENTLNESLKCSITLEIFKDPVFIPDCGHTFDRNGLENLPQKKCPLCNHIFSGNPHDFKTNWAIASILGIEIKKKEINSNEILDYNALKAKKDRDTYVNETTNKLLVHALSIIQKLALEGKTSFDFDISKINGTIVSMMENELKKKGFVIYTRVSFLNICWY